MKTSIPKRSKGTLGKAKAKAWSAFSLYIRTRYIDEEGFVKCVTCPAKKHYKEMQAGHFLPGRNNAVLFSEDGVHPQCYHCNIGLKGNWPEYYKYMKEMYGVEVIDQLMRDKNDVVKYSKTDYEELAKFYSGKVNL